MTLDILFHYCYTKEINLKNQINFTWMDGIYLVGFCFCVNSHTYSMFGFDYNPCVHSLIQLIFNWNMKLNHSLRLQLVANFLAFYATFHNVIPFLQHPTQHQFNSIHLPMNVSTYCDWCTNRLDTWWKFDIRYRQIVVIN